MTTRNIRLLLEYDGTPFLGWQVQPQGPTVQEALETALRHLTGEPVAVHGSGRTDAGVHALGQVANFHTASPLSAEAFRGALNSALRPAIAVVVADEVPHDFHSRFSAVGKTYRYRVFNRDVPSPLEVRRSWHVHTQLDIESMSASATQLIGEKDFSSFQASGCSASSPVRSLRRCTVGAEGPVVTFELEADGFLRHMVRNIVGTLVDIGRGRFAPTDLPGILAARNRPAAGRAAPPWGLYLASVSYPAGAP